MSKTGKGVVILGAAVAIFGMGVVIHNSGQHSALERYKTELRAKGEKLTFKELEVPPTTKPEEVASRKTLDACASVPGVGFQPKLMEFVTPGSARITWQGALHLDTAGSITPTNWESLEQQNQNVAVILAPIITALRTPAPDSGFVYDDVYEHEVVGPPRTFVRDRSLAQALVRAEVGNLHQGNFDAAREDLQALIGLTQANRNELTLVSQMIRIAIGGMGLNATWEILQSPGWDEPRLAALQAEWEQLDYLTSVERGIMADRAFSAVIMTAVRHTNAANLSHLVNPPGSTATPPLSSMLSLKYLWQDRLPALMYRLTGSMNEDELFQLKQLTCSIDSIRDVKNNVPWPQVALQLNHQIAAIDQAIGHDRFHHLLISAIMIPNFSRAFEAAVKTETLRRLTITAIAIKRYELQHGLPPPDLASLTPGFLATAPIDPMSGKPLCYRLNRGGNFTLYSVGEDGKDNGGDPTPAVKSGKSGLWEGRDAVWPSVAAEEEAVVSETAQVKR